MKVRIFLFLAIMALVQVGTARAATCEHAPKPSFTFDIKSSTSELCIEGANANARLRYNDHNTHTLKLFDTDDGGKLLWCAHAADGSCAKGLSLCFRINGNLELWSDMGCSGVRTWESNHTGGCCGALLWVGDGFPGERAEIFIPGVPSDLIIWSSNNQDPT